MSAYSLLLAFDRDDPAFIDGFELGRLWERAKNDEVEFVESIHGRNAEMVLRIAEATGRRVRSQEIGSGWIDVTFAPSGEGEAA